jgi:hypothetical protein
MKEQAVDDVFGDAAPLRAAIMVASGEAGNPYLAEEIDRLIARVRPTADPPDFASANAILPSPPDIAPISGPIGLVIETRRHMCLPAAVREVVSRCNIPVQVMHGRANQDYVHHSLGALMDRGQVIPTRLNADRINGKTYNGLLLSRAFWDAFAGRNKIFIFQTDSMLCRKSRYSLSDFIEFDYIGSRRQRKCACGLVHAGGNGGFSLRDWGMSVRVLDRYMPERWMAGEDDFFPLFMEAEGARVARAEDSDRFCGQRWFQRGCFGLHKPNFRKLRLAADILRYEPGAWRLLSPIEKRLARN